MNVNVDDINIEIIDLEHKKDFFKVMLVQTSWEIDDWEEIDGLSFIINEEKIDVFLNTILSEAVKTSVDCLVFPELSIPPSLLNILKVWSSRNDVLIIAGSHYRKNENSYVNTCPIIFRGKCYFSDKINPSPLELSPIGNDSLTGGKFIKIFQNTPIGNFVVLVCADYLCSKLTNSIFDNYYIDTLIVPAFQNDSNFFHTKMELDCRSSERGIYILYSNNKMAGSGDGKSAAFGVMDKSFFKKLIGYSTDGTQQTKIAEFSNETDYLVLGFNLNEKKPSLPKTIKSSPNIHVYLDNTRVNLRNYTRSVSFSRKNIEKIFQEIRRQARSIIALHGLDDRDWLKALSSQYFLSEIALQLNLEQSDEYYNVIDAFLDFFSLKYNGTIELKNERILVTPDETERLRECMVNEDMEYAYFTLSSKTKAENINTQQLHENYLYGVALGISSKTNKKYLEAVHDLALNYLIYKKNPPARDNHGGWYPYRIPWITARILISISKINIEGRNDEQHIRDVIDFSLESLISRITKDNIWRSGVGEWVSNIESTALCLESFLECDKTLKYKALLEPIVLNYISGNKITKIEVDFSSEVTSNETLANIIMSSVCLRFIKKYQLETFVSETEIKNHLNYCLNALISIKEFQDSKLRQFCTIPQIVSYCLKINI